RLNRVRPNPSAHMKKLLSLIIIALSLIRVTSVRAADPLPSWNEGLAKKAIVTFVEKVTKEGSPDFVSPNERIAVFDNDGTLWCEQPMYFPNPLRARPREDARAATPRMENKGAVCIIA